MSKSCKSPIELFVIAKVRQKRIELGYSQAELAFRLGVSNGFIGQVESSEYPAKYNLNHINKLAQILNCKVADLLPNESI